MQITRPRRFPLVPPRTLEPDHVFDPALDVGDATVALYPPERVVVERWVDGGRLAICRFGGQQTLVVVAALSLAKTDLQYP